MRLAKIMGSIVSTQKSASLLGKKLMVIKWVNSDGSISDDKQTREEIAVDSVGAGIGELVLVSQGSSARKIFPEPNQAIDLAIVGIVDTVDQF